MTENDTKFQNMTKRQIYRYNYVRRPEVMEIARQDSLRKGKDKKLYTTMARFEEHSYDELMHIIAIKCAQKGIDYELLKEDFSKLIHLLHDPV